MKKLLFLTILFFNILPTLINGNLKLASINSAQAQIIAVEEDTDGNIYFPITDGPLPADDGTYKQTGSMCVLFSMQIASDYYGLHMDAFDLAQDYSDYRHNVVGSDLSVTDIINSTGIYTSDLVGFLGTKFDAFEISDSFELMDDLGQNNTVLGSLDLDGVHGHEVVVVSCSFVGQVEYFDPQTGYYGECNSWDFSKLIEVTPKTPL
jgi:hypothetical protein